MKHLPLVVLVCLTVWVAYATARLEYLNARADYRLPMDDVKSQSKAGGGSGAWRAFRMDEEAWKRYYITRFGDEPDRQLTPEEQAKMQQHIRQANANADLRDFAGLVGCIQYPIIGIGIFLGIKLIVRKKQRGGVCVFSVVMLLVNFTCLAVMIYRGPVRALID